MGAPAADSGAHGAFVSKRPTRISQDPTDKQCPFLFGSWFFTVSILSKTDERAGALDSDSEILLFLGVLSARGVHTWLLRKLRANTKKS